MNDEYASDAAPKGVKDISFGEAFRRARDAGLKEFNFKGKKFNTELAPKKAATTAKDAAAAAMRRRSAQSEAATAPFPKATVGGTPGTVTDDPRSNAYFQGRVNPKTLLPMDDSSAMKKGGKVKCYAKGGSVSSASSRADGIASKGKTKCKIR